MKESREKPQVEENDAENRELRKLFHEIWTAQVGTEGYDKSKWHNLRQLLYKKGIIV